MNLIFLVILLGLSALFAGIETAVISLSRGRTRSLVEQKKIGSLSLQQIKQNPHRLLITLLIGSALVNTATAAIATHIAIDAFGDTGVGIATGVVTLLILVFGEITPKSFALQNSEAVSLFFAKPIQILEVIFSPVVAILEVITHYINKVSGENPNRLTESELRSVIAIGQEEGLLDREATKRLQSVLDFERITVKQVMTPKASVVSFDGNLTIEQFLDISLDSPYDHYPLYEGKPENVTGVLDVIDVMRATKEEKFSTKLKEIMRSTFYVKQDIRLDEVLTQFRPKRSSMGIVVGADGKMVGVFTSQDIVEEIVGDIFEEEVVK